MYFSVFLSDLTIFLQKEKFVRNHNTIAKLYVVTCQYVIVISQTHYIFILLYLLDFFPIKYTMLNIEMDMYYHCKTKMYS